MFLDKPTIGPVHLDLFRPSVIRSPWSRTTSIKLFLMESLFPTSLSEMAEIAVQLLQLRDRHSAIYSHKSTQFSSFLFLMRNVLLLSDLPNKRKRGLRHILIGKKPWSWDFFSSLQVKKPRGGKHLPTRIRCVLKQKRFKKIAWI